MGRRAHRSLSFRFITFVLRFGVAGSMTALFAYGAAFLVGRALEVKVSDIYFNSPVAEVAGKYIERAGVSMDSTAEKQTNGTKEKTWVFRVGLLADSHNDNSNLEIALEKVKAMGIGEVIFLGDYSDVGSLAELSKAKEVMTGSGLVYHSIPGDHDLWKSGGVENFVSVFGKRYEVLDKGGFKFILVDNSDTQAGVGSDQVGWLVSELADPDSESMFVFMSNPLYNSNQFKLMGEENESVKEQAENLLGIIRNSRVKAVFAGDNHLSSRSADPVKQGLEHIVVGALASDRNLQTPRFDTLTVFDDGSYTVDEVVL